MNNYYKVVVLTMFQSYWYAVIYKILNLLSLWYASQSNVLVSAVLLFKFENNEYMKCILRFRGYAAMFRLLIRQYMSHDMTKPAKFVCAQRRLRSACIRPVWSETSLCAQWVAKDPRFLHVDSEDSDQTGWMPRLIWVFAWSTLILLALSCRGSYAKSRKETCLNTEY